MVTFFENKTTGVALFLIFPHMPWQRTTDAEAITCHCPSDQQKSLESPPTPSRRVTRIPITPQVYLIDAPQRRTTWREVFVAYILELFFIFSCYWNSFGLLSFTKGFRKDYGFGILHLRAWTTRIIYLTSRRETEASPRPGPNNDNMQTIKRV